MEADVWRALSKQKKKRKEKKSEDTEMLRRFPPSVTRLKLSDKEKRGSRYGGRITCSIQPTLIPSPALLHNPTMRTLHIAQIYGVIQKQLVCLRAVSSGTGAFCFFSLPELSGREYRQNIHWNAAFAKVKWDVHIFFILRLLQKLFPCA